MEKEQLNDLLDEWRATCDAHLAATRDIELQIQELVQAREEIGEPFAAKMEVLEDAISALVIERGQSVKHDGVTVAFRNGSRRVSYKWQSVDAVLSVLKAVLPDTAELLSQARTESVGSPSVRISRVES